MSTYYPVDSDGYACNVDFKDLIKTIQTYGFAVISVMDETECKHSVDAVWEEMNVKGLLDPNDPTTWEDSNWPEPGNKFLSSLPALHIQAFKNRVNPNIVKGFEILYNNDKLVTTIDMWGLKRGTCFESGWRNDWRCPALNLHWDVDIMTYNFDKPSYQGLVALVDCDSNVGSFVATVNAMETIPHVKEWIRDNKPQGKYVPGNDQMQKQTQKICLRKGHMVIWDKALPHGNFSNYSDKCRITQYIRMIPRRRIHEDSGNCIDFWKSARTKNKYLKFKWTPKERYILGLS